MKKDTICQQCPDYHVLCTDIICDTCGKSLTRNGQQIYQVDRSPYIEASFNYTDYAFCDLKCLLQWILNELKKEKINDKH